MDILNNPTIQKAMVLAKPEVGIALGLASEIWTFLTKSRRKNKTTRAIEARVAELTEATTRRGVSQAELKQIEVRLHELLRLLLQLERG